MSQGGDWRIDQESLTVPRTRVLLIAEACNPTWTSVPLVGFNLYNSLKRTADVTLVTQIRNQSALLPRLAPGDRVVFVNSEAMAAPFHTIGRILTLGKGLGWTTRQAVMLAPYLYFEHLVYRRFRNEIQRGCFDLIHRITPLSPTFPSPISCWTDVPFMLGPLNGGLPWPKGTTRRRFAEMEWLSYVRNAYRAIPYIRQTYQRAACVIAGSKYTLSSLPYAARQRAVYIPENGIDPNRFNAHDRLPPSQIDPFRILFVGRLVPYKGADMVLQAFAASAHLRANGELLIVGDGPERAALEATAVSHGIAPRVKFAGHVSQAELAEHFRRSSVFAFPSLREFGGGVVLEAMACGLPCVVVDYGGPGELVTDEVGVRIPLDRRSRIASRLSDELTMLHSKPELLDAKADAAVRRVNQLFTWEAKVRQIAAIYGKVAHS